MGIQRYMFFSIYNCDKYPEVPLMNIKSCTEKFLESSGLNHTTFRLCGFHQVRTVQGHACAAHTQRRPHACQQTVVTATATRLPLGKSHPVHTALQTDAQMSLLLDCWQAVIGNYAVPILEDKPVWGTTDETRTAYLDSQVGHSNMQTLAGMGRFLGGLNCAMVTMTALHC